MLNNFMADDKIINLFSKKEEYEGDRKFFAGFEYVRYDKDLNKHGLKANDFCALVRHKAMGMIKDKESYTKYISNQVDNTNNNIDREEIIRGKTKQF